MSYNSFALCADGKVGMDVLTFFLNNYRNYLKCVIVTHKESEVYKLLSEANFGLEDVYFYDKIYTLTNINKIKNLDLDYLILAWWPYIVKQELFDIPKVGTLNFHPSYLPYNRGKHYNFWTIVEESPFGVSIQFINDKIDGGDIVFQQKIEKTWEDTGESLYYKAQREIVKLFQDNFQFLIDGNFQRKKQNPTAGSFHYASELEPASEVLLDKMYSGRELLNLLRARTFSGYPGCYFSDNKSKYEITIKIRKIK